MNTHEVCVFIQWNARSEMECASGSVAECASGSVAEFNYVVFLMFDGDYGACDDAASYSFLYFEQSDFFHH